MLTLPQPVTVTYALPPSMVFLPTRARQLAVLLALRADACKTVQIQRDELARMLGMKAGGGTLSHHLSALIEQGYVDIITPAAGSRPAQYRVRF